MYLKRRGILATHDTLIGGHADIVVIKGPEFVWVAEAKVWSKSNSWLMAGFDQLTKRYIAGTRGHDCGELLVYCFDPHIGRVFENWINYLRDRRSNVTVEQMDDVAVWRSTIVSNNTGRQIRVRHKGIALHIADRESH